MTHPILTGPTPSNSPFQWSGSELNSFVDQDRSYSLSSTTTTPSIPHIEAKNTQISQLEAELLASRQAILDEESQIRRLRRQIKEGESKRTIYDNIINDLDLRRQEYQSSRAPFAPSRLPAEILGEIFQYYNGIDGSSPWTLTQVSRIWRYNALRTPQLWGGIAIRPKITSAMPRYQDGRENCRTSRELYRALQRAKQAPLQIKVYSFSYGSPRLTLANIPTCRGSPGLESREQLWEMLDMLGGERMRQWRSFICIGKMDWEDLWDGLELSLCGLETLSLYTLTLPLLRVLDKSSSRLRSLRLCFFPRIEWSSFGFLQSLEDFIIRGHGRQDGDLRLEHFPVLKCMPNLLNLELKTTVAMLSSSYASNFVPFFPPTLANLRIQSQLRGWTTFLVPSSQSLVKLDIQQFSKDPVSADGSIHLPALLHLSVHGTNGLPGLRTMVCPNLKTLWIFWFSRSAIKADQALIELVKYINQRVENALGHPFPVQRLKLHPIEAETTHLVRLLLGQITSVEDLTLGVESMSAAVFSHFVSHFSETDAEDTTLTICPNLKRAVFDMRLSDEGQGSGTSWTSILPYFDDMINTRARLNSPIEILEFPQLDGKKYNALGSKKGWSG